MYREINGRVYKLEFISGRTPTGQSLVHEVWLDVETGAQYRPCVATKSEVVDDPGSNT